VGGRRKEGAQAHWMEVVACEEWGHVECSTEQRGTRMVAWSLQLEAGAWGLGSMVCTEREAAPVPAAENATGLADSPLDLVGAVAGVGIEAAGGTAADGQGPLAVVVRVSRGAQIEVQIGTFVGGIEVHLGQGRLGQRGSGFEGGIGFVAEGHSG
jgi:hypothetical protein